MEEYDLIILRDAVEELKELGYDDTYLNETYSGRGMYGATTAGIVTDAPAPMIGYAVVKAMVYHGGAAEDAVDYIPKRRDSMGTSTIYY